MGKQEMIDAITARQTELRSEIERGRERVQDDRIDWQVAQLQEQRRQELQKAPPPKLDTRRQEVIELPKFLRTWSDQAEVEQRLRRK